MYYCLLRYFVKIDYTRTHSVFQVKIESLTKLKTALPNFFPEIIKIVNTENAYCKLLIIKQLFIVPNILFLLSLL